MLPDAPVVEPTPPLPESNGKPQLSPPTVGLPFQHFGPEVEVSEGPVLKGWVVKADRAKGLLKGGGPSGVEEEVELKLAF